MILVKWEGPGGRSQRVKENKASEETQCVSSFAPGSTALPLLGRRTAHRGPGLSGGGALREV